MWVRAFWLWKSSILEYGVDLSRIIGQSLHLTVGWRKICSLSNRELIWSIEQCSTATNHLIVNAIFNISSDLMMLFIPMPIVLKAKLPTLKYVYSWQATAWPHQNGTDSGKRKILLLSVFSLGVFVIASAIANKYYSFTHPFGVMWTYVSFASCLIKYMRVTNLDNSSGTSEKHQPWCMWPTYRCVGHWQESCLVGDHGPDLRQTLISRDPKRLARNTYTL